jgi:hypothetical protein
VKEVGATLDRTWDALASPHATPLSSSDKNEPPENGADLEDVMPPRPFASLADAMTVLRKAGQREST